MDFRIIPVLIASTAASVMLAASSSSPAYAAREREVSVSGSCSRMATPDRASMTVAAEFVDKDLNSAVKKATEAYDRVREAVKRLNLDDLELRTSEYQVAEAREWENSKSVFKGYRARMGLMVSTSSIPKLGEVISIAAREGIQDVGRLNVFLSDEKQRKEQFACLHDAAENARARAKELAGSLGAKLGEIVSIRESEAPSAPIRPLMAAPAAPMLKSASRVEPPSVEAGEQEISATIQAIFALQ